MTAGPCLAAIFAYGTVNAPTIVGQETVLANCIVGHEYIQLNGLDPGATYRVSSCDDNHDSSLSVLTAVGGTRLGYSDNACGL